jgi:hypothetical protein
MGVVRSAIQTPAMNAFRSLYAGKIHVERFYAPSNWADDFMERAEFYLRNGTQNDITKLTNRRCNILNQSFAEQLVDIRRTASSA